MYKTSKAVSSDWEEEVETSERLCLFEESCYCNETGTYGEKVQTLVNIKLVKLSYL